MSDIKRERSKTPDLVIVETEDICELEHLRKLFIGGLAPYTTEDSLKEFYGQFGKIVDVVVMRDPTTKRSRGFGFVTYTRSSMVDEAQDNRPHVVDGKTVEAKRALPRPEREVRESNLSVKKLFVGGLKDNHDDKCLEEYFSQFGNVVSVKILTDKTTGKRRGFAFIEFDDYDSVDKAILQKTHSIKYVLVDVKKSVYNQENRNAASNNNNNLNEGNKPINKQPYRNGPPNQQAPQMGPYGQQPPMNGGPPAMGPPPNYNYWGQPPPTMQPPPYNGYPQQTPMNSWNYPPSGHPWNACAPPVQNTWYPQQQWGPPPTGGPVPPPMGQVPPNASPAAAVPNWTGPPQVAPVQAPPNVTPVSPVTAVPVASQQQQQQPPQAQRPNFGTGYQQSYGGGPAKNNLHQTRVNPYYQPNGSGYAANNQSVQAYKAPSSNNVAITAGGSSANKFRR